MNSSVEVIQHHAREVEEIARPLTPVLLYIRIALSPEALAALTNARGEAWTTYAIEALTNCPYARHRQLSGGDGAMAMLSAYHAVVQELLRASTVPRLELDACSGDWPGRYRQVDDFLAL